MSTRSYLTQRDSPTVLFPFIQFSGDPIVKSRVYERVIRQGVPGIGLLRHAERGRPFQVQTFVDATDDAHVSTIRAAYLAARGGVLDLYWQGVLFDHVLIHAVHPLARRIISGSVGGVVTGSTRVLPAVWQMEAVT